MNASCHTKTIHRRMALIAPYFPISDIEKDDKLKACCGFARAYLENAAPDGEINAGYLRYIKSQRKDLYIDAIGDGALLHLLFAAKLIQPKDIEDLMWYKAYFHKDTEALIQEYRDRYLGPADPVKEAEQKKKAAEKSAKSMEEFEATGVMKLAEAEKLFNIKREKGNVIITRYKNYTSPDADVVIPRIIGKSPVTGINAGAFSGTPNIRSVTIPEGVKTIGGFAFTRCFNLQSVTLPKSLREMVSSVFMDCEQLESITIPGGLKHIPYQCFSGCSSLTSVTIEKGVKIIGQTAFSGCNIESLTIPEGVTSIENYAFWGCRNLREVTIPESVTEIGHRAFEGCVNLQSVTIPENVTEISDSTFEGCSKLQSVTIPKSVKKISGTAFKDTPWRQGLGALAVINHCLLNYLGEEKDVILPEGLEEIGDGAFEYCAGIQSVTIPDSVVAIENGAFSYCEKLRSIVIPESVTELGALVFCDCKSLQSVTIPGGIKEIRHGAFDGCENLRSVTISKGVTSIGYQAFNGCVNLTDVAIPASVTEIDQIAFTHDSQIDTRIIEGLTIHAPTGSYAEQYARENDIKFQPL